MIYMHHYLLKSTGPGVMRINIFNFLLLFCYFWFKCDLEGKNNEYRTILPRLKWIFFFFSNATACFQAKQIKIKLKFSWKIQRWGKKISQIDICLNISVKMRYIVQVIWFFFLSTDNIKQKHRSLCISNYHIMVYGWHFLLPGFLFGEGGFFQNCTFKIWIFDLEQFRKITWPLTLNTSGGK